DDDPTLTIRDMGYVCQPVRVIVSSQADFAGKALRSTVDQGPIWICHDAGAKVSNWADVASMLPVASVDGKLDPHAIVESLGKQGLTSVLCEGGGQLAASLLKAGLVDDLMIFTAGLAIGGDGRAGLGNLQIDTLDQADRFSLVNTQVIGDDILHHWRKSPAP
ncbi:MAG: RibD family protein, partial [Planktomarina sp.]